MKNNSITREQLAQKLDKELAQIINLQNKCKKDDYIHGLDEYDEYREPLSITPETTIHIQLSWGGPADGFKIKLHDDLSARSGVYYWQDWGTYDEIELTEDELSLVVDTYLHEDPALFLEMNTK